MVSSILQPKLNDESNMTELEQLMSDVKRLRLLRFFLFHPDSEFSLTELTQRIGKRIIGNGRILRDLLQVGCITEGYRSNGDEKTYHANQSWLLYQEFRALFTKSQLLLEHDLMHRLEKAGRVTLLILSGLFVGERHASTDVLIVGAVNRQRVTNLLKKFERDLNEEVRYTVMSPAEYRYRKDVGDRFIYDILEHRHLVVSDSLSRTKKTKAIAKKSKPKPAAKRSAKVSAKRRR